MNVPLCLDPFLLKNGTTDFDETLHVAQACPEEGFKIGGMSRYPLVWLLGPPECHSSKMCVCLFILKMCVCLFIVKCVSVCS